MTEMEMEKDIHNFLDRHQNARRPTPSPSPLPDTPGVTLAGLGPGADEDQLFFTYFEEATWSQSLEHIFSAPGRSLDDGRASNMSLQLPPSEGSRSITDDSSSIHTPEPVAPNDDTTSIYSTSPSSLDVQFSDSSSPTDSSGLGGYHDNSIFPTYEVSDLPRPETLDIPRSTGKLSATRHRVVKDVPKTNLVRGTRACIPCRIKRISCSIAGICETCTKSCPQRPDACCIRKEISAVARESSHSRFAGLERGYDHLFKQTFETAHPEFLDAVFEGRILSEPDASKYGIPAVLRNYVCKVPGDSSLTRKGCTFSRSHKNLALKQEGLLLLSESSISLEYHETFEGSIENFIRRYSKPSGPGTTRRPHARLLELAHLFKAMYKIYRARTFYFAQPNGKVSQLPLPAQAEIRGVAKAALVSSERDILTELDKYFKSSKIPEHERPVIWAVLWQVILVYRDLLMNVKPWRYNAEPLLNALSAFYATFFRTSASLKLSLVSIKGHWPSDETQQAELGSSFDYILSLRGTFHQSIAAGVHAIDQRLKAIVIDPEMKVLRRRQSKKSSGGKQGAPNDGDEDELMGGC